MPCDPTCDFDNLIINYQGIRCCLCNEEILFCDIDDSSVSKRLAKFLCASLGKIGELEREREDFNTHLQSYELADVRQFFKDEVEDVRKLLSLPSIRAVIDPPSEKNAEENLPKRSGESKLQREGFWSIDNTS